jgi:hypothetical protein
LAKAERDLSIPNGVVDVSPRGVDPDESRNRAGHKWDVAASIFARIKKGLMSTWMGKGFGSGRVRIVKSVPTHVVSVQPDTGFNFNENLPSVSYEDPFFDLSILCMLLEKFRIGT